MWRALGLLLLTVSLAPAKDLAGKYSGQWTSGANDVSGDFRLALAPAGEGQWKLEVSFTFSGSEVKATTRSIKVEGSRFEAVYDFDLGGNNLRSTIQGQLAGDNLEGAYKTTTVADATPVDQGTWKAAPVK